MTLEPETSTKTLEPTVWRSRQVCEPLDSTNADDAIVWLDIESGSDPEEALGKYRKYCAGLDSQMLEELVTPDGRSPEPLSWDAGNVRLVSTFIVRVPREKDSHRWYLENPSTELIYEPVEIMAGKGWLLTCWHRSERYKNPEGSPTIESVPDHRGVVEAVKNRWIGRGDSLATAGDLGVLVMHEFALTYASAYRQLYAALDAYEMKLYGGFNQGSSGIDRDDAALLRVWSVRAQLWKRLTMINVVGLKGDLINRAWLPASNEKEVDAVDEYIDRALEDLRILGDRLQGSFHNVQMLELDVSRERRAHRERRIERMVAIFLVPTFVVGFYGANTWVPGEHRVWGFFVMLAVITVLTMSAFFAVKAMQEGDRIALLPRSGNSPDRPSKDS